MTYTFKIAKRLALGKQPWGSCWPGLVGCQQAQITEGAPPPPRGADSVPLMVTPAAIALIDRQVFRTRARHAGGTVDVRAIRRQPRVRSAVMVTAQQETCSAHPRRRPTVTHSTTSNAPEPPQRHATPPACYNEGFKQFNQQYYDSHCYAYYGP